MIKLQCSKNEDDIYDIKLIDHRERVVSTAVMEVRGSNPGCGRHKTLKQKINVSMYGSSEIILNTEYSVSQ